MSEIDNRQLDTKPYRDKSRWIRIFMALLFGVIFHVTEVVFAAVAVFQWAHLLIAGSPNPRLNEFAGTLTKYMRSVLDYICLRADEPPWPLGDGGRELD